MPETVQVPEPFAQPTASSLPQEPPQRPLWNYPATYSLIALNLLVFAIMVRFGPVPHLVAASSPFEGWRAEMLRATAVFTAPFSAYTLQVFGACAPRLMVTEGQWWRLGSSLFVHVTVLHLLINMWCLWNLGVFGEPLLGKFGLAAVYVLTGAAGMLQTVVGSLTGRGEGDLISAGASGAIFGIAGILIVLLSSRKLGVPRADLRFLRLQVIFFALANLLFGSLPALLTWLAPAFWNSLHIAPGTLPAVDNAAHLGGLLSGVLLGLLLFPRLTSGRSSYRARQVLVFGCAGFFLVLATYAVAAFANGGKGA